MLRSPLTDFDFCEFYAECAFSWVFGTEQYRSDSGPIQLANLIDLKLARFREDAGDLRNCREFFSDNNYKLSPEPSWEDAS